MRRSNHSSFGTNITAHATPPSTRDPTRIRRMYRSSTIRRNLFADTFTKRASTTPATLTSSLITDDTNTPHDDMASTIHLSDSLTHGNKPCTSTVSTIGTGRSLPVSSTDPLDGAFPSPAAPTGHITYPPLLSASANTSYKPLTVTPDTPVTLLRAPRLRPA